MTKLIDWTKLEKIPAGKETEKKLIKAFNDSLYYVRGGVRNYIVDSCRNRTVLDIGAIEHGVDNMGSDSLFFRISKVAKRVKGLDIIEDDCKRMREKGFDFVCVDATSDIDLGERFDVVNVGDVIEHVDSPVALLAFCKRHLKKDGKIFVTTPNPYYIKTIIDLLKHKHQISNFQHIGWFMPCHGYELGRRVGLVMSGLVVSDPINFFVRGLLFWLPYNFKSGVFCFVFSLPDNSVGGFL